MHVNNSHTDGDSYIYFPEDNVIHMGDNFSNGGYPFIDLNSGGDIDGFIKNLSFLRFTHIRTARLMNNFFCQGKWSSVKCFLMSMEVKP